MADGESPHARVYDGDPLCKYGLWGFSMLSNLGTVSLGSPNIRRVHRSDGL